MARPVRKSEKEANAVLFDQLYRGDVWRLEIAAHEGRRFGNWRKWFWKDGELQPTRQGVTIPLDRMTELHSAIGAYLSSQGAADPGP
ncbi:hypothetical protein C7E20_00970 [Sphingobium sp. AEW4]|nr:hypothetical protein C7E20_00970 [Sphingobium sp. AEW4]